MTDNKNLDDLNKDLATHVRTTHFGLVAACFVLLSAYENPQKEELDRAFAQARTAAEFVGRWNPAFVHNGIQEEIQRGTMSNAQRPTRGIDFSRDLPRRGVTGLIETKQIIRELALQAYTMRDSTSDACLAELQFDSTDLDDVLQAPTTLHDFQVTWDLLSCFTHVYIAVQYPGVRKIQWSVRPGVTEDPLDGAPIAFPDEPHYAELRAKRPQGRSPRPLEFELVPLSASRNTDVTYQIRPGEQFHLWSLKTTEGPSIDRSGFHRLEAEVLYCEMPAPMKAFPISAQQFLLRATGQSDQWNLPLGRFARTFPDLNDSSDEIEGLDLAGVERILEAKRGSMADSLQLFGAQLPTGRLSQIGIAVILAIQAYLFAHVFQYYRIGGRATKAPAAAWIGSYRTFFAFALTWLTAVALPGYTHWLLQKKWPATVWEVLAAGPSVMATLGTLAALAITVLLVMLWRRQASEESNPNPKVVPGLSVEPRESIVATDHPVTTHEPDRR